MKFNKTQAYKYYKILCIVSLLSNIIVVLSFIVSFMFTYVNIEWGYVGWIIPLLLKMLFLFSFAIAIGYFMFILYLEYIKKQNISLCLVNKIDNMLDKIIHRNIVKIFIFGIGNLSLFFDIFLYIVNFLLIIIGFIAFAVCLLLYNMKHRSKL